jgi:uncharacterized membrane protein YccC
MKMGQLGRFLVSEKNPATVVHAARTAVAVVVCYLLARLCRLPEAYWAPISTMVVMQSTLGATVPVSAQRFAGTAVGAAVGAVLNTWFRMNIWVFGAAVLLIGILCAAFRVERTAYRYAGITLAIVMLVPRSNGSWVIALHRFFEVSLGIAVGLLIAAVWPERPAAKRLSG